MTNTFPFEQASRALGSRLHTMLSALDGHTKAAAQEIRLRSECKISLRIDNELKTLEHLPKMTAQTIKEAFESICGYSVYAHQNDIAKGFVTVQGGHRAGICGTAVVANGQVTMLRDITAINLRIARDFTGCSALLFSKIQYTEPTGLLIAGAPMSGKTTLLRDIAAALSMGVTGRRYAVSLLDERGELAAVCGGSAQYEGVRSCDILSGYPKDAAIALALRSMAPEVIVCDEIGTEKEAEAIAESLNAGVAVIASVHAGSEKELLLRPAVKNLLATGAFRYTVLLSKAPLSIEKIIKTEDLLNEEHGMHSDSFAFGSDGKRTSWGYQTPLRVA